MMRRLRVLFMTACLAAIMAAGIVGPVPSSHAASTPMDSAVVIVQPPEQQPPTGRQISRDDWIAHTPLLVACFLVVIAVDFAFIGYMVVKRTKRRQARRQAVS